MIQLPNSYKETGNDNLNNGVLELKKNTPFKITLKDKDTIFRIVEKETICVPRAKPDKDLQIPFTEILDISITLSNKSIAVLGHECYSREFAKATDLLYIFFPSDCDLTKCCCYAYDMKHSLGSESKDVIRFHGQCISSIKYALSVCLSAISEICINDLSNVNIHFGLITENFEETSLKQIVDDLKIIPSNPTTALEIKMQAQNRQGIINLPILESILNKKIKFNGKLIDLDVRIMNNETHSMFFKFNNGKLVN